MSRAITATLRHSALTFAALGAAAGLCASAADARALSQDDTITFEHVNTADLDLGRKSGQAMLKRRIHLAATHVCEFDRFLDTACVDVVSVDGWNQALRLMQKKMAIGSVAALLIVSAPRN